MTPIDAHKRTVYSAVCDGCGILFRDDQGATTWLSLADLRSWLDGADHGWLVTTHQLLCPDCRDHP
jgi:hypothetical protein